MLLLHICIIQRAEERGRSCHCRYDARRGCKSRSASQQRCDNPIRPKGEFQPNGWTWISFLESQRPTNIFSDFVSSKQSENLQNDTTLQNSHIRCGGLFLAYYGRHFKTVKRHQSLHRTGIASLGDLTNIINICHCVDTGCHTISERMPAL
jgi:hypothetical protein